MIVNKGKNAEDVIQSITNFTVETIQKTIEEKGICSIVLAGGNTPKSLYKKLAEPAIANTINWNKVYFFWGDERYVPNTHVDSNEKMAKDHFLNLIPVPTTNIFPIPTSNTPEKDAAAYNQTVQNFLLSYHEFSLILLGLGSDGHTLSLFPGTNVLQEREKLASSVWVPQLNTFRISLTYTAATKAKKIAFLVTGTDKAAVINNIIHEQNNAIHYPSTALVAENKERVHWFIEDIL
jgi:6-phosphogluconolactonase